MIHIVAQCHEEGLEHYLRSYVKVTLSCFVSRLTVWIFVFVAWRTDMSTDYMCIWICLLQFVFRTEPYTSSTTRTVHEELAKAMTAILKPSTDFLTSNKLLKVTYLYFLKDFMVYNYSIIIKLLFIVLWLVFVCPAVLLVFLWSLSQVHGSVLDWEL